MRTWPSPFRIPKNRKKYLSKTFLVIVSKTKQIDILLSQEESKTILGQKRFEKNTLKKKLSKSQGEVKFYNLLY